MKRVKTLTLNLDKLRTPSMDEAAKAIEEATRQANFAMNLRVERDLHLFAEKAGITGTVEAKAKEFRRRRIVVVQMKDVHDFGDIATPMLWDDRYVGISPSTLRLDADYRVVIQHTDCVFTEVGFYKDIDDISAYGRAVQHAFKVRREKDVLIVTIDLDAPGRGPRLVALMTGAKWAT